MTDNIYGVMVLKFEFWLTTIILIGGGLLMWADPIFIAPVFAVLASVIGFWFNRRNNETTAANLMTAMQTQPPTANETIKIPIAIVEQPKQSRAPE